MNFKLAQRYVKAVTMVQTLDALRKKKGNPTGVAFADLADFLVSIGFKVEQKAKFQKNPYPELGGTMPYVKEMWDMIKGQEVPSLPSNPQVGDRVYMGVTPLKPGKLPTGEDGMTFEAHQYDAKKCAEIEAPNGDSFDLFAEGSSIKPNAALGKWLMKVPSYVQSLATSTTPLPTVTDSPRKTQVRTLDNTGTCPVCSQNVKLKNGDVVLHGYKRPGMGSGTVGKCFGVGYPPIEVSDVGARDYLVSLSSSLEDLLKEKQEVVNKNELPHPHSRTKKVTPFDPQWREAVELATLLIDRGVREVETEKNRIKTILSHWKPLVLVDQLWFLPYQRP